MSTIPVLLNWYTTKSLEISVLIFIVQLISNNLEQHVCKALTKCATFCSVKSFKKIQTSTTMTVYLLYSIFTKKKYLQVHMPLYLTIYDRSEAKQQKRTTKIIC